MLTLPLNLLEGIRSYLRNMRKCYVTCKLRTKKNINYEYTKKETFLFLEGEMDKKNKLLKSDARLSEEELRRLNSGKLTIGDLNQLLAKKARIFKYGTQITVHARFPGETCPVPIP